MLGRRVASLRFHASGAPFILVDEIDDLGEDSVFWAFTIVLLLSVWFVVARAVRAVGILSAVCPVGLFCRIRAVTAISVVRAGGISWPSFRVVSVRSVAFLRPAVRRMAGREFGIGVVHLRLPADRRAAVRPEVLVRLLAVTATVLLAVRRAGGIS